MSRNKVPKRTQLNETYNVNKSNNHRNGRHIKDSHKKPHTQQPTTRRAEEHPTRKHACGKSGSIKKCDRQTMRSVPIDKER